MGYVPIAFLVLIAELAVARFLESDLELVPEPCPWWWVVNVPGNPRVLFSYPYPYPSKPLSVPRGKGSRLNG